MPTEAPGWKCPAHHRDLAERDGALVCPEGDTFPVVGGIPRFVRGEEYTSNFGAQWKKYRLTQLDSYTGTTITADRIRRCLGDTLWNGLAGRQVLECGCGAGRFTEVLLGRGAVVTSIDLSTAVEANAENFPIGAKHRIAQADIYALPFGGQEFDVVFCLGVIQHTPDPERTIAALYSHVKPGGVLIIDHYTWTLARVSSLKPLFRAWLKRRPADQAMRIIRGMVDRFLPLHRRFVNVYPAWMLLSRFSPLTTFYKLYPELNEELQREWCLLDTHDSLTDWFKHLRTRGQIERLLRRLGLEEVHCIYGGNGVEARGRRPLAKQA